MTAETKHQLLGEVTGLDQGRTIAYRGIKYAELEHAFAEPTLINNPTNSRTDATSYG